MNIKPKYINGEPVCSGEECDQYHDDFPKGWWVCLVLNKTITKGLTCIPGLRRARNQHREAHAKAIKERDDWHDLVVRCEQIFKTPDTTENPLASNLVNLCRDAQSERNASLVREKTLQREVCTVRAAYSPAVQEDNRVISEVAPIIAKQRGWDCFEGGE